jgi:hypothetical protein
MAHRGDSTLVEETADTSISKSSDPDNHLFYDGGLLPGPHAVLAGPTFATWVEAGERQPGAPVVNA